jgi:hypothetical protein
MTPNGHRSGDSSGPEFRREWTHLRHDVVLVAVAPGHL